MDKKQEIISVSQELYNEIDNCIDKILKSRINHTEDIGGEIHEMESLLIKTQQHLTWVMDTVSDIK